ncbi:hypothetical protein BpHYR1_053562 [Brachionus plicatilis]|uniref:Uncharacterized protein n=1 Tax=Brachionus plicatilis TaxID=10195 RepID=A0A3M7Q3D2_BRAPC|nr:hypothetical protein BpHYR1_053562 [Brachionus plicatilis]
MVSKTTKKSSSYFFKIIF